MSQSTAQAHSLPLEKPILWVPLVALAALYGMFTLSWVVYRIHLPSLMTQFGFSQDAITQLLLLEALIAIGQEPIMGYVSDRLDARQRRFSLISSGVVISSAMLIGIAGLATFAQPVGAGRWWLPGLLLIWAIGMGVFRSPVLALLRRFAATSYLPLAASCLTLVAGLAGATNPLAKGVIQQMGVVPTFGLCAILLVIALIRLRSIAPDSNSAASMIHSSNHRPVSMMNLGIIFVLGLAVTLSLRLTIESFPYLLGSSSSYSPILAGLLLICSAVMAFPAGKLAVRWGNRYVMLGGLMGMAVLIGLLPIIQPLGVTLILAAVLGLLFGGVSNGTFPFSLLSVPYHQAGLAIGTFFGGAAATTSILTAFSKQFNVIPPTTLIAISVISCLVAAVCVWMFHPQHNEVA